MKKAATRLPSEIEEGSWLKIGEVSKRSGVGVEALRFYERSGLIDPPGRTGGGYRLYDASMLDRLEFIKRTQALGFSLNEIAQIIVEKWAGHSPCEEVREIEPGAIPERKRRKVLSEIRVQTLTDKPLGQSVPQ